MLQSQNIIVNTALSKKVSLRTSRRIEFYNANIEYRLLKYELYAGKKNKMVSGFYSCVYRAL